MRFRLPFLRQPEKGFAGMIWHCWLCGFFGYELSQLNCFFWLHMGIHIKDALKHVHVRFSGCLIVKAPHSQPLLTCKPAPLARNRVNKIQPFRQQLQRFAVIIPVFRLRDGIQHVIE